MRQPSAKIVYTHTDEAPALATYAFLPIIKAFTHSSGVKTEMQDISLASRILANFPENLTPSQQQSDALTALGKLAMTPEANIIKLPNISASIPQLQAAITELQSQGYEIPDYPEDALSDAEKKVKARYAKVLGSAVNPVLREGNSDRRVAAPVKAYAQKNPHRLRAWSADSQTHVAHMHKGDFFGSEQSVVLPEACEARIELVGDSGTTTLLKPSLTLQAGEFLDASVMSCKTLRDFLAREIEDAREKGVLLSLHLKATMMKVSDPIIFGHAVTVFYKAVFDKYADIFAQIGVDPRNGLGDVYAKILKLPKAQQSAIESDLQACYANRPKLAMVNSEKGITNLHVPSDVIIDASMPVVIRDGGCMWGPDGKPHATKAIIPDRCYAGVYQEAIRFCKAHGAFDVSTMGSVANVGLMAQKAEEYGSHDKTFQIAENGIVRIVDTATSLVLIEHEVEQGDIWRACQTKLAPIRDWVRLAVSRARATGSPAIFWLSPDRAHDANLIKQVQVFLQELDTDGLDIQILSPEAAMRYTCERAKAGKDTISVTGNVLRDYLTDLFPILELGTSAKMLSIVPLLAGGGLFETGAGGSAPKHVQQFVEEGHLRWDSLGEFLALAVSLEDLGHKSNNSKALILAETLNTAIGSLLDNCKSPSRDVNELDNRGSQFYLALYWAQALGSQTQDADLQQQFASLSASLEQNESRIIHEINAAQGAPVDIGGYYHPSADKTTKAMRPSTTLNTIMDQQVRRQEM
ncbi:MAG: NADP-dependent isocitrate dehydrogenase [Verrucomicrobia bacterium]|nr:NADP-dependent isocitrate dehydrogenase [Verrucomicrobiota bacterium]